jgi:DNA-binding LacI/PurR family transcriptional regulator
MKDRGLDIPPEYIAEAIYHDVASVKRETAAMLDLPDPPTAILYPDDYAFMGGQAEILERGLNIPGDISVCGYDGVNLAKILDPKLTTWEQDTDQLGRIAVDKLIDRIENPSTAIPEYVTIKGKLFEGETVKQL